MSTLLWTRCGFRWFDDNQFSTEDESMNTQKHIDLLDLTVSDKITGIKGVVVSVSFDISGCIQVVIDRGMKKDGSAHDKSWYDVSRLNIIKSKPVMTPPNFVSGLQAEGKQGAIDKPTP